MDVDSIIKEQLTSMDMKGIEELFNIAGSNGSIFADTSPGEIIQSIIHGQPIFDFNDIIASICDLFLKEIYGSIILGVQLVIICIIIGLLKNLSTSFSDDTVSNLGVVVCSCSVMALCLKSFMDIYAICSSAIDTMSVTMQALLPVIVPLLITMGGFASGGILNPLIMTAITIFNTVLQRFIMPAVYLSCIFILVNSLSEKDYVKKLALFIRGFSVSAMGLSVTLFSGITVIQGVVTKSADGMIAKTARFSVDNFVPIVGGFAADSIDLILSCTTIIKNGIGIFGVIIILTLLLIPLIKILAVAMVYKITAIIIEPIGNKTISDCLNEVGNTVITLAIILFLGAMMFLIFLAIIIGIGGGSLWR
ncbi:stage III sporulation protein AE [Sinanaerobacter chloroacetimidivorans]|jgi:stage III sporulation protein AE|uniref:Stage III sporulation protein AE n=1 Tax=Sinanaerobacter chloroacetimidivorans TaxID=2818044 RepID=A0A8J7VX14_9FIRM|nr:stage III sporulation protein AE [Sinanaerobacter chloroacetimidivorans]MBR0596627.1 stage III sporulation protein AE [Sinanaerobacter chloroacetimidivorans]